MKSLQLVGVILTLISTPTWAQESDNWDWKIAPYLWAVNLDGEIAIGEITQDIDVSFSDILSDFELGGAVYAEVGKGNNAFHIDYTYIRTRPDPTPLPAPHLCWVPDCWMSR